MKKISYMLIAIVFVAHSLTTSFLYDHMTAEDLVWLLKPTSSVVSFLTGHNITWVDNNGYKIDVLPILIEKSCAGFTYLNMMIALVGVFLFLKRTSLNKNKLRLLILPVLIYLYVIVINGFRIVTSIGMQKVAFNYSWFPGSIIHELLGVFYFFLGLFSIYHLIKKYFIINNINKI
jgi:exosortase K